MEWCRVISAAPAGAALLFADNRWFAPPANVRCPSGTNHSKRLPFCSFCPASSEEGLQEPVHLIVGPHHVEVEHVIVDQRENQPDALA